VYKKRQQRIKEFQALVRAVRSGLRFFTKNRFRKNNKEHVERLKKLIKNFNKFKTLFVEVPDKRNVLLRGVIHTANIDIIFHTEHSSFSFEIYTNMTVRMIFHREGSFTSRGPNGRVVNLGQHMENKKSCKEFLRDLIQMLKYTGYYKIFPQKEKHDSLKKMFQ
jgi:hypothetical protein